MSYRAFDLRRMAGALGAELAGVDLSGLLDDTVIAGIRRALLDHQVIFFHDQHLTPEQNRFSAKSGSSPNVNRHERQLARRGRERDGRACSPSVPRTSAKVATAPTSASAPATAKAASKPPVAATT
jgi:Taurine catabolism dioxygenase TauD, TfdA family